MANKRPNIVFYFSDQQRWDTLGCYGQRLDVTPNLDRIASEGTRFEYAFTCQPVCGPARACLQTGRYATAYGCYTNGIPLPVNAPTVAKMLGEAGYATAYAGKWHLASESLIDGSPHKYETCAIPKDRRGGFVDYWMAADVLEFTSHGYNGFVFDGDGKKIEFIGYRPECVNNYALDFIRNRDPNRPFYLFVSQIEPHHQNDRGRYEGPDGSKGRYAGYDAPGDLAGEGGDWRENYPDYLGCCNALDSCVGKLFDTLEEQGILNETLFIYASDHGSHFKTRNGEYKRACHDACARIPLIMRGPGFMGGSVKGHLASLIDLPATVISSAGLAVPGDFDGRPLNEMVSYPDAVWEDSVFMQISESQIGRCVRTSEWKYSVKADGDGWRDSRADEYYEEYLYDLRRDPHEKANLVRDPSLAGVRMGLSALLAERMARAGESRPIIRSAKGAE